MKRVNVSLPDEVFAAMEERRGDVSRSRFVLRAVGYYLETVGVERESDGAMVPPSPVPVPTGSSPEPPSNRSSGREFELPKIAPRSWGR